MSNLSPGPLSTSGRRALAATMLGTATRLPALPCTLLIDGLDAVSWALLAGTGVTPAEARALLSSLWVYEPDGRPGQRDDAP